MGKLAEAIKAKKQGSYSFEAMYVEQSLNKLFHSKDRLEEVRAGMHASAIIAADSHFCYREMVLSMNFQMGQGEELPTRLLKIFAAGNSIHEKWQTMLERELKANNEERAYSEEHRLYFTPDVKVRLGNKRRYIGEIKSMNMFSFKGAEGHPSGEKQCMMYMHMTGIPYGFVLAENKNDQTIRIFYLEYDYKKVLPFLERMNQVGVYMQEFEEDGFLPDRRCTGPLQKRAEACAMKDACFECGMGRVPLEEINETSK